MTLHQRIDWAGRPVDIEFAWAGVDDPAAPLLVVLGVIGLNLADSSAHP